MKYVYIQSEPSLWSVGFYHSDEKWEPESDHTSAGEAAKRVAWLNGEKDEPTLSMTEPPNIPEAYRKTIVNFLAAYYGGRRLEMQESFGFHNLPTLTNDQLLTRPLAHQLAQIARAAAGQIQDADDLVKGTVYQGIQELMEALFAPYGVTTAYDPPPARWWDASIGQMVARALLWLKGDEMCWHQCQFARLRLCKRRLDASDAAMARGDLAGAVKILKEELGDRESKS